MMSKAFETAWSKETSPVGKPELLAGRHRLPLLSLFICLILLLAFGFVQWHDIGAAFSNDYDEGVYLCSARMVRNGYPLFSSVFSSQPPAFIESIAICFHAFGVSVQVGRGMILFFALVGLATVALMSARLLGWPFAPGALIFLGLSSVFFGNARTCTAEMPSIALALVAMICVQAASGKWHLASLAVSGACFALAVLTKLLVVPTLVPMLLLVCLSPCSVKPGKWRLEANKTRLLLRILVFSITGIIVSWLILLRYDVGAVYDQAVRFHEASRNVYPLDLNQNRTMLQGFCMNNLGVVALSVLGLALLWQQNRLAFIWLSLWISAAGLFLLTHTPLFNRHFVLLSPPLALAASSSLLALPHLWQARRLRYFAPWLIVMPFISLNSRQESLQLSFTRCWHSLSHSFPQEQAAIIELIEANTGPKDFIVTDQQMQAFRAARGVEPFLCDTSFNRILSGHLTDSDAIKAAEGARMIIFSSGRLENLSGFVQWVESHYVLAKEVGRSKVFLLPTSALSPNSG